MEQRTVEDFRRMLLLSGDTTRFNIAKVAEFKPFTPLDPQVNEKPSVYASREETTVAPTVVPAVEQSEEIVEKVSQPAPAVTMVQEKVESTPETDKPKVSMEELDKRLEEILGE